MFGLICNDAIPLVSHCLFLNFRQALYSLIGKQSFKDVSSIEDLDDVTHLFIVDEHFGPNVNIWKKHEFVNRINERKIRTLVFNFEPIYDSPYQRDNIHHQLFLEQIQNLTQFLSDVNDFEIIKSPFLNRQYLSKETYVQPRVTEKIKDKVLFIGQASGHAYVNRIELLRKASSALNMDIVITDRRLTYDQFLDTLSKYQFVLNPLGIGRFINLRHYEILKLGSVPIQQVTSKMMELIPDLHQKYSINFTDPEDLRNKDFSAFVQNQTPLFLEDYLADSGLIQLL